MRAGAVDILMYHAIADAPGPTSIAPAIFAKQMEALAASGVPVITLDDMIGRPADAPYAVAITFDDGFRDFADTAWPILARHGFRPIVYLPSDRVGGTEDWPGCHHPPRRLMGWAEIRQLADDGVLFGSHSVSHPDLTMLEPAALETELTASRAAIEAQLDRPVPHFAPPYGSADAFVRRRIAALYETSVGTRLGTATADADRHDLPRLEMFYFTDIARWRAHLAGRGVAYLARRRLLRRLRQAVQPRPWTADPR